MVSVSVPLVLVTTTSAEPAVPEGVSHVMVVELVTTMLVALVPPKVIVVSGAVVKSIPTMVTDVPPAVTPSDGVTLVIVVAL